MKTAIYPLSGDPVHNGHIEILKRALSQDNPRFDHVYFLLGKNCDKKFLFSDLERVFLSEKVLRNSGLDYSRVSVDSYSGMTRDYAVLHGAKYIIRGVRNRQDREFEEAFAKFNSQYGLKSVILDSSKDFDLVSSSLVKSLVSCGDFVGSYVHPSVKQALEEKIRGVSLIGVTGSMGAGKSTFCENLVKNYPDKISHIDLDKLVHEVYHDSSPLSENVRKNVYDSFGEDVFDKEKINRKKLAKIIFDSKEKNRQLMEILKIPTLIKLKEKIRDRKGTILLDAAYLSEYNMLPIVNQNMILVGCDEDERFERIFARDGIKREEIEARMKMQFSYEEKKRLISENQKNYGHGFFMEVNTSNPVDYQKIFNELNKNFPLLK